MGARTHVLWSDKPYTLTIIGNFFRGFQSCGRLECCTQELNLVSEPCADRMAPVYGEDTHNSLSITDYEPQSASDDIVSFIDEKEGKITGAPSGNRSFSTYDATSDTDLRKFFSRPVKIDSRVWLESDPVGYLATIRPWYLWLNNTYVKKKLDNYSFFRGDLHIKIVISASPFYYGLLKFCYAPCISSGMKEETISNDAATRYLIPYSQRRHIDVLPHENKAGQMILPFIWHHNMIDVQTATYTSDLGKFDLQIYAQLQSANGAAGTGVTVTTYAWCDNVTLSGASVGYSMQSDEYEEDGIISAPATRIADAASYFENIPIIGPFAVATRIGASAVAGIARLFGYTNVPIISDTMPYQPNFVPNMASSEIGFPIQKLTLDPKNELSVDPRIIGLQNGEDEMVISTLGKLESYLTTATWTEANLEDYMLFSTRVNPRMYDNDGATQSRLFMTPCCWLSNAFNNWRGDMVYKIHVVCSKYHKGRLRISYDPTGYAAQSIINTASSTNVVHTTIMDIGETHTCYLRIPYQARQQFLQVRPSLLNADEGWAVNAAGTFSADKAYDNGTLTVRVLNVLTAPIAATTVKVLISCYCENLELANPTEISLSNQYMSYFYPQSEEIVEGAMYETMGVGSTVADNQYVVHFGENILSLRQLLRRMEYHSTKYFTAGVANSVNIKYITMYKIPASPGFDPQGPETATKLVGAGNAPYNFAKMTMLSYFLPAFVAYRGSTNCTITPVHAPTTVGTLRAWRDNVAGGAISYGNVDTAAATVSTIARANVYNRSAGAAGMSLGVVGLQQSLSFTLPSYTASKFYYANATGGSLGSSIDGSLYDKVNIHGVVYNSTATTSWDINYGAGTDFSLYYFLNVPTVFIYSAYPTGV